MLVHLFRRNQCWVTRTELFGFVLGVCWLHLQKSADNKSIQTTCLLSMGYGRGGAVISASIIWLSPPSIAQGCQHTYPKLHCLPFPCMATPRDLRSTRLPLVFGQKTPHRQAKDIFPNIMVWYLFTSLWRKRLKTSHDMLRKAVRDSKNTPIFHILNSQHTHISQNFLMPSGTGII